MIKTHTETREIQVLDAIVCDRCRREARPDGESQVEYQEFVTIRDTGGFGSVFGDGTTWEIHLCQHCVKALLDPYIRVVPDQIPEEEPPP